MPWMTASECADWWNGVLSRKNSELDAWMEKNNHGADGFVGFSVYVGTHSAVDAANLLFWDNLKLGDGSGAAAAGGSKWGYFADATRLVAFIPLARLPGIATRELASTAAKGVLAKTAVSETAAVGGRTLSKGAAAFEAGTASSAEATLARDEAQLYKLGDPYKDAPICWAVAPIQALNHSGKYYMKLSHIAKLYALPGMTEIQALCRFQTYNVSRISDIFKSYKIAHVACDAAALKRAANSTKEFIEVLENLVPKGRPGSLVFGVRWKDAVGKGHAHIMFAARDAKGLVQIHNRGGEVVRDLKKLNQLGPGYAGIERATMEGVDSAIFIEAAQISNIVTGAVKHVMPTLLLPVFVGATICSSTKH